jgi:hypothetical protein
MPHPSGTHAPGHFRTMVRKALTDKRDYEEIKLAVTAA